jgi:hypothetical protein
VNDNGEEEEKHQKNTFKRPQEQTKRREKTTTKNT